MLGRRRRIRQNWLNKLHWPIQDRHLDECPYQEKFESMISREQLAEFQAEVNKNIAVTFSTIAPYKLQYGGAVIALIVMILGAVAVTEADAVVGAVLFLLGLFIAGLSFWYRQQLLNRAWKKVGQYLHDYFKVFGEDTPGVSFEFHVQGHHSRKRAKHKNKKNKGKKGGKKEKEERSTVWYERYIVIYLPGDQGHYHDFVDDPRSANEIVAADSKAVETYNPIINESRIVLPYWWATAKNREGQLYYINNLKHRTQWSPPTYEQIEMEKAELQEILAPPGMEELSSDEEHAN